MKLFFFSLNRSIAICDSVTCFVFVSIDVVETKTYENCKYRDEEDYTRIVMSARKKPWIKKTIRKEKSQQATMVVVCMRAHARTRVPYQTMTIARTIHINFILNILQAIYFHLFWNFMLLMVLLAINLFSIGR